MDRIFIRELEVACRIGVPPEERADPQRISIDVTLEADLSSAARSDALEETIDYNEIVRTVKEIASQGEYSLLERLAGAIADALFALDGVLSITVSVKKHQIRDARYYGVEVTRTPPAPPLS